MVSLGIHFFSLFISRIYIYTHLLLYTDYLITCMLRNIQRMLYYHLLCQCTNNSYQREPLRNKVSSHFTLLWWGTLWGQVVDRVEQSAGGYACICRMEPSSSESSVTIWPVQPLFHSWRICAQYTCRAQHWMAWMHMDCRAVENVPE